MPMSLEVEKRQPILVTSAIVNKPYNLRLWELDREAINLV